MQEQPSRSRGDSDIAIDGDVAWTAVLRRDRSQDGRFVTGVLTTGIYCRPSCAARQPFRQHVRFFADGAAARKHGLRACKRCLPDDVTRDRAAVTHALDLLAVEPPIGLVDLASTVGYTPHHFLRLFRRDVGVTPTDYSRGLRMRRVERALISSASVTEAIYRAGYVSASRFYADAKHRLAMTPAQWCNRGEGVHICWLIVQTPLGEMLLASTEKGLCHTTFDEGEESLLRRFPSASVSRSADTSAANAAVAAATRRRADHGLAHEVQCVAFELLLRQEHRRSTAVRHRFPNAESASPPTPTKDLLHDNEH